MAVIKVLWPVLVRAFALLCGLHQKIFHTVAEMRINGILNVLVSNHDWSTDKCD